MPTPECSDSTNNVKPEGEWGFMEWFFLGAMLGFLYTLFRYPGTWGCLFLFTAVFLGLAIVFYWEWLALAIVIIYAIVWLKQRSKEGKWPF